MTWAYRKNHLVALVAITIVTSGLLLGSLFNIEQAEAGVNCENAFQPFDPLELSVDRQDFVRFITIAVEKESFDCGTFVRDVSVIITKIESRWGVDESTRIQVLQCDKDLNTLVPVCTKPSFLNTITTPANCLEKSGASFVEEDSFSFISDFQGKQRVFNKFVILEKEILQCGAPTPTSPPTKLYEVFTFEELLRNNPTIFIHTIICEKNIATGTVIACQDFGVVTLP